MSSSSASPESWISSFCSLLGHEYFAEVSEDFIEDDFNLTGLQQQVPMYKEALEMILDVEPEEDEDEEDEEDEEVEDEEEEDEEEEQDDEVEAEEEGMVLDETGEVMDRRPRSEGGGGGGGGGGGTTTARGGGARVGGAGGPSDPVRSSSNRRHMRMASDLSMIESSAELLYGLIHQRYITSRAGIQQMAEKYELQHFGVCPRVNCNRCRVLPVGATDTPGIETVKLFCPSCLDIYTPPNSRFQDVDGAFFGTTFGCLFFMTFPELDVGARTDFGAATHPTSPNAMTGEQSNSLSTSSRSSGLPMTSATSPSSTTITPSSRHVHPASHPQNTNASHNGGNSEVGRRNLAQPWMINGQLSSNLAPGLGSGKIYESRIYGFRVSERARAGPRMRWLRSKPTDLNELDELRRYHEKHPPRRNRRDGGGNDPSTAGGNDGDETMDVDDENDEAVEEAVAEDASSRGLIDG